MKELLLQTSKWIKRNPLEFFLLILILGTAAFFRFYKINEVFYFVGDAGRDAQAAYKIIFDHKLTLIGPKTSVGGFYLGPFYFYLITLPLLIFKMNPIGLGYATSFVGVVATFLAFLTGKILFDKKTGLIIAFLYATSSIIVSYSRTAWNPSPIPLFTFMVIILTHLYQTRRRLIYLWLLGLVFGLGIQLHYNFICLLPPAVLWLLINNKTNISKTIKGLVGLIILLFFVNLPLIIFELRHEFITSHAFLSFLQGGDMGFSPLGLFGNLGLIIKQTIELAIFSPSSMPLYFLLVFLILISSLLCYSFKRREISLLFILFFLGSFFFAFFKGTMQLYYLNFLLPFPIIFAGVFIGKAFRNKIFLPIIIAILLGYFVNNWSVNTNLIQPKPSLQEMMSITESITQRVSIKEQFNIATFLGDPWHSAEEYRYLSYYYKRRALGADDYKTPQLLFIINKGEMKDPLSIHSQETDNFTPQKITEQWNIGSYTIFEMSKQPQF